MTSNTSQTRDFQDGMGSSQSAFKVLLKGLPCVESGPEDVTGAPCTLCSDLEPELCLRLQGPINFSHMIPRDIRNYLASFKKSLQ